MGQHRIAARNIRLGTGSVDVTAVRGGATLRTIADVHLGGVRVRLGHVLPAGARVKRVSLDDGGPASWRLQRTSRGRELVVAAGSGRHRLVVTLR